MIRRWSAAAWPALFFAAAAFAAPRLVAVPGEDLPPAVTALGSLERVETFGVSGDGGLAIASFPSEKSSGRSVLRIARADAPASTIELGGTAAAIVVASAGDVVFVIVRETDKKGVVRRVGLVRVDSATGRTTQGPALPASAGGLAFAAGETTLLVSAKDEVRSFGLPQLTSGPLYRVPGNNSAVAPLAASSRALLAQGARIVLVDFASTQDRDGLKLLDSVDAGSAVKTLVSAPDEGEGMALLADGRLFAVATDPLKLSERPPAFAVAWSGVKDPLPETRAAAPVVPPAPASVPIPEPAAAAVASPPTPQSVPPAAPPAAVEIPGEAGSISGSVTGPARASVIAIVVLGPDNVLKEATRVIPDASGAFSVQGLRTGSYRIVAAGENGRVLVCSPPFVTVRVGSGGAMRAPALDVLKAY